MPSWMETDGETNEDRHEVLLKLRVLACLTVKKQNSIPTVGYGVAGQKTVAPCQDDVEVSLS
jgi:hypothetical protein